MTTTGQQLRAWRKGRKLTQQQLADLLDMSRDMVRRFEAGQNPVDRRTRLAMAAIEAELEPLFGEP